MSPATKKILGTLFAAALSGAAAALPEPYRVAGAAIVGLILGALHIARPGDTRA